MMAETIERLNAIITIQAKAIEELYLLLLQHISVEEADSLSVVKEINRAAELRAEIGGIS